MILNKNGRGQQENMWSQFVTSSKDENLRLQFATPSFVFTLKVNEMWSQNGTTLEKTKYRSEKYLLYENFCRNEKICIN